MADFVGHLPRHALRDQLRVGDRDDLADRPRDAAVNRERNLRRHAERNLASMDFLHRVIRHDRHLARVRFANHAADLIRHALHVLLALVGTLDEMAEVPEAFLYQGAGFVTGQRVGVLEQFIKHSRTSFVKWKGRMVQLQDKGATYVPPWCARPALRVSELRVIIGHLPRIGCLLDVAKGGDRALGEARYSVHH